MDTLYGILGLAVLIGLGYLLQKGKDAARKATNKNILYRSEFKEGQQLVKEHLNFETTSSVPDIMRELRANVITAENNSTLKAVLYESSSSAKQITYAYGNKLVSKTFEAAVTFANKEENTIGTFKMLTWTESDGMVGRQDEIKNLRRQVVAAFTAADPSVKVTGTPTA